MAVRLGALGTQFIVCRGVEAAKREDASELAGNASGNVGRALVDSGAISDCMADSMSRELPGALGAERFRRAGATPAGVPAKAPTR